MIVIKRLYLDTNGSRRFKDEVSGISEPALADPLSSAVCAQYPESVGIFCIEMENQVILAKWAWDPDSTPPGPVKVW